MSDQKYVVKWYLKLRPETRGQGQPVDRRTALDTVAEMNSKYPDIVHFADPV